MANESKKKFVPTPLTYDYLFARFKKKLLNTASSIFVWENLPESIDENYLTTELIESGKIGFLKFKDELVCVRGNWGGGINKYLKPEQFIYSNTVIGSGSPEIGKNIAVIFLTTVDTMNVEISGGLSMLIDSTATLLADNELSLNIAQKNTRLMLVADADSESTVNSAECVLSAMYEGKAYKVVHKRFQDSLSVNPLVTIRPAENIRQLIETRQYIWSSFLQELGINSNFNMKRERLITSEVETNGECLDTLIDDIERNVKKGVDMVNSLYGTNISFRVKRYGEELNTETDNTETDNTDSTDNTNEVVTTQQDSKEGVNDE